MIGGAGAIAPLGDPGANPGDVASITRSVAARGERLPGAHGKEGGDDEGVEKKAHARTPFPMHAGSQRPQPQGTCPRSPYPCNPLIPERKGTERDERTVRIPAHLRGRENRMIDQPLIHENEDDALGPRPRRAAAADPAVES